MTFNPQWIKGKKVARVDMRPFDSGHKDAATHPVIYFTDGSRLTFYTQETEGGEYGTGISYRKATP